MQIIVCFFKKDGKVHIVYSNFNWLEGRTESVVGNEATSGWRSVISSAPQGLILGTVLFNIFISGMGAGVECTISRFANDTEQESVVDCFEG